MSDFIEGLVADAIDIAISAWVVMLCLGIAHSYTRVVPAFGFLVCLFLTIAARVAAEPAKAKRARAH